MIEKLIAKFGVYIAGFVGILGLLVGVFFKGKKAARQEIKADTVDVIIEINEKVREIDENIGNTTRDERIKRLLDNASDAE